MEDILIGVTDRTILVFIPDPASTDGSGKTGLTAADLTVSYTRAETDNDVVVTDVTSSLSTLSALTDAHTDWGVKEVSSTLAPGLYRLDVADAVFASGAWYAVVYVMITTSAAAAVPKAFRLVAFDALDGVRLGLTALPNAAADAAGGLPISDAGGLDLDAKIGALTFTVAGDVDVNVQTWGGTAISTPPAVRLADAVAHGGTLGSSTATLALSRLTIASQTLNTHAMTLTGNGTGYGLSATGTYGASFNGTTTGVMAYSDSGYGLLAYSTSGVALQVDSLSGSALIVSGPITATNSSNSINLGTGAITAAVIANGAIDAATFAADVDAEILSYIVDDATRIDASALNTANVTSIPAILEDTGTTLPATLATIAAYVDTEIGTIITHLTDIKGATWASTDSLEAIRDRGDAAWTTANVSSLATAAALSSVAADVTAILADTGTDGVVVATASKTGYALSTAGLAAFFTTNSGATYATAVAGSVVKETADNAGGASLTVADIVDGILDEALSGHATAGTVGKAIADIESDVTLILEDTGTTLPAQIVGVSCNLTAQEIWEYTTRTLTSDSVVASSASLAVTWEPDLLMMGDDIPHSLSYYRRTGKDTYAGVVTITSVIREDIAAGALDSAGAVLPRGSVAYHFQSLQVSYTPPAPFDRVVEGSAAYTIHEISNLDDGKRYKIICKPER